MATVQHAEDKAPETKKGEHLLKGELCTFSLGGELPKRRWFTVSLPFGMVRRVFKVEPYDPERGKGEQRKRIDSHVRKLVREMKAGNFTPASWSGGVRDGHLKNLEIDEKRGVVKLTVNERNPLALLDGGHRFESLEEIRKESDKDSLPVVDGVAITVQIYLDPKYIRKDFRNLQAGRQVSRSQLKFMEEEEAQPDPNDKKYPVKSLSHKVAWILNKTENSFLFNDVNFAGSGSKKVEYASITTMSGSDIGTSIAGGVKITLYSGFNSFFPGGEDERRDFLVACYKAIYDGIWKYGEKEEYTDPVINKKESFPQILMPERMLRPKRLDGTKGGTGMLIMLGNMLAFRLLAVRRKAEIVSTEVKRLVECAQQTLDCEIRGGGSGTAKREATGEFVRLYFEDVVRHGEGDQHDSKKLDGIDGVPQLLCDKILTRSTLNVSTDAVPYLPADDVDDHAPEPRMSDPDQTDPEWTEEEDADTPQIEPDFSGGETETEEGDEFTPPTPKGKVKVSKKHKSATGVMG